MEAEETVASLEAVLRQTKASDAAQPQKSHQGDFVVASKVNIVFASTGNGDSVLSGRKAKIVHSILKW